MDRLLSGDVGFGKTEVAMNALIAVINSGYQTVLYVQLHFWQHNTITQFQKDLKSLE